MSDGDGGDHERRDRRHRTGDRGQRTRRPTRHREESLGPDRAGGPTDRPCRLRPQVPDAADATTPPTTTVGQATDGQTTNDQTTDPTAAGADSGTMALQPCDLLTPNNSRSCHSAVPASKDTIGAARACQWQESGNHTVTVGIFDDLAIDEVVSSGEVEPLTVGSRAAVQYSTGATCGVSLEVTDSSRVDVFGIKQSRGMDQASKVAKQAAELVESNLP